MLLQSVEDRAELRRQRTPTDEDHPTWRAAQAIAAFGAAFRSAIDDELARLQADRLARH